MPRKWEQWTKTYCETWPGVKGGSSRDFESWLQWSGQSSRDFESWLQGSMLSCDQRLSLGKSTVWSGSTVSSIDQEHQRDQEHQDQEYHQISQAQSRWLSHETWCLGWHCHGLPGSHSEVLTAPLSMAGSVLSTTPRTLVPGRPCAWSAKPRRSWTALKPTWPWCQMTV